jgi:hypothetical protein
MIDSLWRERRPMMDQFIGLTPRSFALACWLEVMRRRAIAAARRVRDLLKR